MMPIQRFEVKRLGLLVAEPQARGWPQLLEPPGADPHAGWCGRGPADTGCPYADRRDAGGARACSPPKDQRSDLCVGAGLFSRVPSYLVCGILKFVAKWYSLFNF